jgi:hypothetical protein
MEKSGHGIRQMPALKRAKSYTSNQVITQQLNPQGGGRGPPCGARQLWGLLGPSQCAGSLVIEQMSHSSVMACRSGSGALSPGLVLGSEASPSSFQLLSTWAPRDCRATSPGQLWAGVTLSYVHMDLPSEQQKTTVPTPHLPHPQPEELWEPM